MSKPIDLPASVTEIMSPRDPCAACGAPAEGNYGIHRDGFADGPEVPLCDACGAHPLPTCEQIWAAIAARREP